MTKQKKFSLQISKTSKKGAFVSGNQSLESIQKYLLITGGSDYRTGNQYAFFPIFFHSFPVYLTLTNQTKMLVGLIKNQSHSDSTHNK